MLAAATAVLAACAGVLAAPAAASAKTQTAHAGGVSASFSYTGRFPGYSRERLQIRRAGRVAYDAPVASSYCNPKFPCDPGAGSGSAPSVHVLDLESDRRPDVVLDLFTGGAHCCTVEQVFRLDRATGTYVKAERNFGDPGARIRDLRRDGRLEFVSADDSFAYAFTDFADSGFPVQILTFRGGRFVDVTRQYPALIRADAGRWLRLFKHHLDDGVGLIAAYAADEDLLGRYGLVRNTLARELRKGDLRSLGGGPGGSRFVHALQKFLRQHGYRR